MSEAPARLYAGFDGGGTRTTCVLCDPRGSVLGVGSGGRSNYHNTGLPRALASIKRAFEGALSQSGMAKSRLSLEACFGLAGLDSAEDMAIVKRGHRVDGARHEREARRPRRERLADGRGGGLHRRAGGHPDRRDGVRGSGPERRQGAGWSGWEGGGTSWTTGGAPTTSGGTPSTRR